MNLILIVLTAIGLAYGYMVLYALIRGQHYLYRPPETGYRDGGGLIRIPGHEGVILTAIHRPLPDARVTVLLLHGNGEDLADLVPLIDQFGVRGYSVLAYDYRGYGLSGGVPTERDLRADNLAVFDYAVKDLGLRPESMLVYGRSLGGGLATHLAGSRPVGWLVLEGTFLSAFRVATRFRVLPIDRFRNGHWIRQVSCPVLIIHAMEDPIIPTWHAKELFRLAPEPKRLLLIEGQGHIDLHRVEDVGFWAALGALSSSK